MKTPRHVVLFWSVLGALIALPFQIQAAENGVSIASAFQSALAINPELQAAQKRLEASNFAVRAANNLTPEPLSLEGSYRSDRNFENQGLREVEMGIVAPLWLWGERTASKNLADAQVQSLTLAIAAQKLDLARDVRQAYWSAVAAQVDVEIAQARLVTAQHLMDDVNRRVIAGDLAEVDLLQAKASHAQAKLEQGTAAALFSLLGAEFTALTGLPAQALKNPAIEGEQVYQGQTAVDEHPALVQAKSLAEMARLQGDLAAIQSRANAEVSLALVSEKGEFAGPEEKSLIFGTRIPLGSSAKHQSKVLNAQADELAAVAHYRKLEGSLKARARAAASSADLFDDLKKTAAERAKVTQEALELIQQSFNLGETDLPTLLGFEQQAFEAERLRRKAIVEHATRVSDHQQALGILPENNP